MSRPFLTIIKIATIGVLLSQPYFPSAQAEEGRPPLPPLLEEGGNLSFFDPVSMSIHIQGGGSFRIDPIKTQVVIVSERGVHKQSAGQIKDLAGRLTAFRGRPLSFESDSNGMLRVLVLDEVLLTGPAR